MDILLFGGAFDPPHKGHRGILAGALEYKKFDKIIVMPTGTPGHKAACHAPFRARKYMAQTAFGGIERDVEVSSLEGDSFEKSYSYITVEKLSALYPGRKIWFVIGSDSRLSMFTWVRREQLMKSCAFLIFDRGDTDDEALLAATEKIRRFSPDTTIVRRPVTRVSSTQVRDAVFTADTSDDFVLDLLDKDVLKTIREYSLYSPDYYERNTGTARLLVKLLLKEKRAVHTYNVYDLAVKLARQYGQDTKKAGLAALLHDIMKQADSDTLIYRAARGDITGRSEERPLAVLHGFAAADYAATELGIEDEDLLMALRSHTCGRVGMSDLEKIIYLADMLCRERNFAGKDKLLAIAQKDLDLGMQRALEHSIEYLKCQGTEMDRDSLRALDYFTALNKGEINE